MGVSVTNDEVFLYDEASIPLSFAGCPNLHFDNAILSGESGSTDTVGYLEVDGSDGKYRPGRNDSFALRTVPATQTLPNHRVIAGKNE